MKITILCSSVEHPINSKLKSWMVDSSVDHDIELVRNKSDLSSGDLLFLISCFEVIGGKDREGYKKSLVIHASDLPRGRGWSPHVWQVLEGLTEIVVSLLEAEDKVDSGNIWHQQSVQIPPHSLYDEINDLLFNAEIDLMNFAISHFDTVMPEPQNNSVNPSYYPRRLPEHSELDPDLSIREQFDLMRICDPYRFPAFFKMHDTKYKITLEKTVNSLFVDNKDLLTSNILDRCSLRPMGYEDLTQVLAWRNHPDIKRYMYTQHEITFEEHERWFHHSVEDEFRHCLIFELEGKAVGFVSFDQLQLGPIANWGFYIAPDGQRGIGRLLGVAALQYAFDELKLHKICGQAIAYNKRSIDFHKKLGFTEEGSMQDQYFDGVDFHSVRCFGLVVADWRKNF